MRRLAAALCAALAIASFALPSSAEDPGGPRAPAGPFHRIRVVDFEGEIAAVPAAYVERQIEAAKDTNTDCLVLRIDSPGGTVYHSMEIADALLALEDTIHVVAWIPEHAYSGAAMVALACDEIVMGRSAHMGDAQPGTYGAEGWKAAGEKMESPLRAKLRAYAERNGYPVALAAAMVSARLEVLRVKDEADNLYYLEGEDFRQMDPDAEAFPDVRRSQLRQVGAPVVSEDELLTLTTSEARDTGFLRRRFEGDRAYPEDEDELLDALKASDATVEFVALSFSEEASRVLLQIAGILSAVVAISLMLLIWQGPGVMTIVGGVALLLVLLINFTAGQLHGFPIFLLIVGVLLLAAEVFVIPGFGIAGLLGIAAMGTGFLFLASGATFDDLGGLQEFSVGFGLQFVTTLLVGLVALFLLGRFLPTIGPARRMVLAAPEGASAITSTDASATTTPGAQGIAASALRPAGKAEVDGELLDVTTDGDWIPEGAPVVVTSVAGNQIVVRRLPDEEPA